MQIKQNMEQTPSISFSKAIKAREYANANSALL